MTKTLSWIHFGDLHISNEGDQNHLDFLRLIAEVNRHMRGDIAFGLRRGAGRPLRLRGVLQRGLQLGRPVRRPSLEEAKSSSGPASPASMT